MVSGPGQAPGQQQTQDWFTKLAEAGGGVGPSLYGGTGFGPAQGVSSGINGVTQRNPGQQSHTNASPWLLALTGRGPDGSQSFPSFGGQNQNYDPETLAYLESIGLGGLNDPTQAAGKYINAPMFGERWIPNRRAGRTALTLGQAKARARERAAARRQTPEGPVNTGPPFSQFAAPFSPPQAPGQAVAGSASQYQVPDATRNALMGTPVGPLNWGGVMNNQPATTQSGGSAPSSLTWPTQFNSVFKPPPKG